ncbi:MAG: BatD family protein [Opitutaceae bacterium]
MHRLQRFLLALGCQLLCVAAVFAQSVAWDPPAGTLARGQTSELSLVFDDCAPAGEIELPVLSGLQVGRPAQSSQTSIVNFKMSQRVVLAYPVVPTATSGRIAIPEFEVETNKGRQRVAAASYEIGDATVGRNNIPLDRVASAAISADPNVVWAGQVFDLKYQLLVSRRFNPTGVGPLDWAPPTVLVSEPLAKFENIEAVVGGDQRVGVATRTRALVREPGTHVLPVARQPINLAMGGNNAFDFFGRQSAEQYLITSSAPTLLVKPLPAPAPADFLKAVGQFTFTGKVVPATAAVGEPITWTLALEGTGNWPEGLALPAREVSRDFRAFQPSVQRKTKDGTLFEGTLTEDIVLMPTKPGTYTLGPVSYSYFDPVAGSYKTATAAAVKVTVTPPVAAASTLAGPSTTGAAPVVQFNPAPAAGAGSTPVVKTPAPELPGRLPLEPLGFTAVAPRPWRSIPIAALLAPLGPVLVLWLALGWRRARLTDSRREQRLALAELPDAISGVARASDAAGRAAALRNWQQLAALAFAADHAAPAAEAFGEAVRREQRGDPSAAASEWTRLWHEADLCLYRRETALPNDWSTRAAAACARARLKRLSWFAALRPSNLWPIAAALLLLCALPPRAEAAGAGEDAYRRAEFANAEQTWRAGLAATPDDWPLRHDLGLAVAQQSRWAEAAAQWSVAFLAAPRDPSVRWHLALGLERADFTQPELSALAAGTSLAALARLAAPVEWQRAALAGGTLLALALAAVIAAQHRRSRWLRPAALLCGVAGAGVLAGAVTALHVYGPLAHPDAVLVWKATELRSVPTEAGEQKPEPLAAGSIALWQKSFLGWDQLRFANGQTGWTRRENLQPLYPRKTTPDAR